MQNVISTTSEIIERLKTELGYANDADIARDMGMPPKKLAVQKLRGTISLQELITICSLKGFSLEWVLTGRGDKSRQHAVACDDIKPLPLDELPDVNKRVLQLMDIFDLDEESFLRRTEMDPIELASIKAGRPVSGLTIRALAFEFELRLRWLRMGELPVKVQAVIDHAWRDTFGKFDAAMRDTLKNPKNKG